MLKLLGKKIFTIFSKIFFFIKTYAENFMGWLICDFMGESFHDYFWSRGYKIVSMFNWTEHEISTTYNN